MRDVIIWGCPRSGTSITLELFQEHGGYRHWFEPGMWVFGDDTSLWKHAVKNPVSVNNTPGLSANIDDVCAVFPDALHIWVRRNPFDTVCSLKPGMEEQPHPPALPDSMKDRPLVDRCAYLWAMWNITGQKALREKVPRVDPTDTAPPFWKESPLLIYYEMLVAQPYDVGKRMFEWADTWVQKDALERWAAKVSPVSGVNEAHWQDRWRRPHEFHVGRWRTELSEAEIVAIENITGISRTEAP